MLFFFVFVVMGQRNFLATYMGVAYVQFQPMSQRAQSVSFYGSWALDSPSVSDAWVTHSQLRQDPQIESVLNTQLDDLILDFVTFWFFVRFLLRFSDTIHWVCRCSGDIWLMIEVRVLCFNWSSQDKYFVMWEWVSYVNGCLNLLAIVQCTTNKSL